MGIGLEVDPCSIDAITEAMILSIELPDYETRVLAGKQRATELSWRRCAEETLSVYKSVISRSAG